jgi:hypothetical protein
VLKVRSLLSFAVKHFMCVIAVTISQLLLFICIGYKFGITYYMVNLLLYTCIEDLVTMGYYREVIHVQIMLTSCTAAAEASLRL